MMARVRITEEVMQQHYVDEMNAVLKDAWEDSITRLINDEARLMEMMRA